MWKTHSFLLRKINTEKKRKIPLFTPKKAIFQSTKKGKKRKIRKQFK
jgi:hypothetical protein